jgi:hypothetical protein
MHGSHLASVIWEPAGGINVDGYYIVLEVDSRIGYGCSGNNPENDTRAGCDSYNTQALAEALHQAAIKNGLYEPMPEESLPATIEEVLPIEPEEVIPDQPEVPSDETVPTEPGGLFGIPLPIILGSLGIPIAGAAAGAVLSAIMSGLSSAAVSSPGAIPAPGIQANDQGLY